MQSIISLMIFVGFGVLTATICLMLRKDTFSSWKAFLEYIIHVYAFSTIHAIVFIALAAKSRFSIFNIAFENYKSVLALVGIGALTSGVLAFAGNVLYGAYKNRSKITYCKSVFAIEINKKNNDNENGNIYPIMPLVSLKYLICVLALFLVVLMVADKAITPYSLWEKEDAKFAAWTAEKLSEMNEEPYPLWRINGHEVETTGDKKTILVIGDSFIMGDGSSNVNLLWWRQLDKELKSRGYEDVAIYAIGRNGASTYHYYEWIRDNPIITRLNPDLIVLTYVTNDGDQYPSSKIKTIKLPDLFATKPLLKPFNSLYPNMAYLISNMLNEKLAKSRTFTDETGYPYMYKELTIVSGHYLQDYNREAIAPLGALLSELDIPYFMVTTPTFVDREYYRARYGPVLPLFEQAGIPVYNMLDDYVFSLSDPKHSGNIKVNPVDEHPGTATTKFYADYVADILEKDYNEVIGEKAAVRKEYPIKINDWMPYTLLPVPEMESSTVLKYKINYPPTSESQQFLTLPINQDYVKLNFQYPVNITSVNVNGDLLEGVTLHVTKEDEHLGYDKQELYKIGKKKGNTCYFELNGDMKVTSLCISADMVNGLSDFLIVSITCGEEGVNS